MCAHHLYNRAQLQREKQAREDAEKEKRELADRVRKFEMEAKRTQDGMREGRPFHLKSFFKDDSFYFIRAVAT